MNKYIIAIFSFFLSINIYAQWEIVGSAGAGNLYGVYCGGGSDVITVGDSGIYESSDGGDTFIKASILDNSADSIILSNTLFKDVYHLSDYFAVGKDTVNNKGVIFKKNDEGEWELNHSIDNHGFNGINRVNYSLVAVGDSGRIVYTEDYGVTWEDSDSEVGNDLYNISYKSNRASIAGDGIILESSNFLQYDWNSTMVDVNHVDMTSTTAKYIVSDSQIAKSPYYNELLHNHPDDPFYGTAIDVGYFDDNGLITTRNGILVAINSRDIWEIQPTTLGYAFNDVHINNGDNAYVVGDEGLVMYTTNLGGAGLPIIDFEPVVGDCFDSTITVINNSGTNNEFIWKINDTIVSNEFQFDTSFAIPGEYNFTLIANNGTYIDSLVRTIVIATPPLTDLNINVIDSILCHEGNSDIEIENSQPGVIYSLIKLNLQEEIENELIATIEGSGGTIQFNTGAIYDSTQYIINARANNTTCQVVFPDTILVAIEKTTANFHPGLINARLNEGIIFNNNSKQASYYYWDFGTGASELISIEEEPIISYNTLGPTEVFLRATSLYGCSDSITLSASEIYNDDNLPLSGWALAFNGNDLDMGYGHDIAEEIVIDSEDNVLTCGSYNRAVFTSKAGVNLERDPGVGFFIANHSKKGVLRWVINGMNADTTDDWHNSTNYSYRGVAFDMVRDMEGNIYVSGWMDADFYLATNDGDTTRMHREPLTNRNEGFVIKLDRNGRFIWQTLINKARAFHLAVDDNSNVYISGRTGYGISILSTDSTVLDLTGGTGAGYLAKINSEGVGQWITNISGGTYYTEVKGIDADPSGNVYLCGQYASDLTFYSVFGPNIDLDRVGSGSSIFVAKYSTEGNIQWANYIDEVVGGGSSGSSFIYPIDIVVSPNGNSYTSSKMNWFGQGNITRIKSSDGSIDSLLLGEELLTAFDTDGMLKWGTGSTTINNFNHSISLDKYENIYLSGRMTNDWPDSMLTFTSYDSSQLSMVINTNAFYIAKYDPFGNINWLSTETGPIGLNSFIYADIKGMASNINQELHFVGEFRSYENPLKFGLDSIVANETDVFFAKYSPSGYLQADSIVSIIDHFEYCLGEYESLAFYSNANIEYDVDNIFEFQICGEFEDFSNAITLGSLNSSNNADTIEIFIPDSLGLGKFKSRIVSSHPYVEGNMSFIYFEDTPAAIREIYTICDNERIELTAREGHNFVWSKDSVILGLNTKTINVSPDTNSVYLVKYTYKCDDIVDTIQVNVNPTFLIEDVDDEICFGDSILIYNEYRMTEGTYFDSSLTHLGCDSVHFRELIVHPLPIVEIEPLLQDSICYDLDSLLLPMAFPLGGDYNGQGVTNNYLYPDSQYVGLNTLVYTYTDSNQCTNADTVSISIIGLPEGSDTELDICFGDSVVLEANEEGLVYMWTPLVNLNSADSQSNLAYPDTSTVYYSLVQNICGSFIDSFDIVVNSVNITYLDSVNICQGDSFLFYNEYINTEGTFQIVLQNEFGCDSILEVDLHLIPNPIVSLTEFEQDTLCLGQSPVLLPEATPLGGTFSGPGIDGDYFNPELAGIGLHTISYHYEDTMCYSIESIQVFVDPCNQIEELNLLGLSIFPNPTSDFVTISGSISEKEAVKIDLLDSRSRFLQTYQLDKNSSSLTIHLEDYSRGVYYLHLSSSNRVLTYKLIVN